MKRRKQSEVEGLRRLLHTGSISTQGLTKLLSEVAKLQLSDDAQIGRRALGELNSERHLVCFHAGFVMYPRCQTNRSHGLYIMVSQTWFSIMDYDDGPNLQSFRFVSLRHIEHVPLAHGGNFEWEFADPNRLLASIVEHSPGLTAMYADAVRRSPPSMEHPWSLVVGFDEFTPGNKLQSDNRRKCMVLSFTFRELGQSAMCSAIACQTPVVVRETYIKMVAGGWSNLLKLHLQRQLLGPGGLATAGVPVVLNGSVVLIFAKLTNLLSDGDGHRIAFDWKGHASLKPCFKHFNVFKKDPQSMCRVRFVQRLAAFVV